MGKSYQFNGKDVSHYVEAYIAKLLMRDILEARQLSSIMTVVSLSLHMDVIDLQP